MPRPAARLTVLFALALLLLLPGIGQAAEPARIELATPPRFHVGNATLLIGDIQLGQTVLRDPGVVRAHGLSLPEGTLYVCPAQSGQRGEIPPLPVLEERCRDETAYEDPQLSFGSRTWLAFRGNHSLVRGPNASMDLVAAAPGGGGALLARVPSADGMRLALDEGQLAFRPTLSSSEVVVQAGPTRDQYNGTDWIFYFDGTSGETTLRADGVHARLTGQTPVRVAKADPQALTEVLEPRILLDLQVSVLGPDAREPVSNATGLFEDQGRVPHLLNGAILGHLRGTIGPETVEHEVVTLVHVASFEGAISREAITGQAEVHFQQGGRGFTTGLGEPVSVPWWLVGLLWLGLGLALVVGKPAGERAAWERWASLGLAGVAAVAWDLRFGSVTGVSVAAIADSPTSLGVLMALAGFELISLAVAAALLLVPLRLGLARVLPAELARWGRLGSAVAWLLYVLVLPGTVIAMGLLVARL